MCNNKSFKSFVKNHLILMIDCIGLFVVIATFIPIFFINEPWNAILISFSINTLTTLLVLTFVDQIIDIQRKRDEVNRDRAAERSKILRIHKLIEQLLPNYIMEFNQITMPLKLRTTADGRYLAIDYTSFKNDFTIKDLVDFDVIDITVNGAFYDKAITSFRLIQDGIIEKMERMITEIEFVYYCDLEGAVLELIKKSQNANGIKQLEFLSNNQNKHCAKLIKEGIEEYDGDPFNDYISGKYSGNALLHIVNLFMYLVNMRECFNNYLTEIKKIENE